MNIGKAAKLSGLTVKTVRYYANINLVKPYQDRDTAYRDYSDEDIAKLQFIGKARQFNFNIEDCRVLMSLYEDKNRPSKEVKELTLEKISEIDKKLSELISKNVNLAFPIRDGIPILIISEARSLD